MTDLWEPWWPDLYADKEVPQSYPGSPESYQIAGEFLAGDELVEEWGCATTWGKQFIPAPYRGVDGGPSQFVDVVADLREYTSEVPNALIRHVLEHNWEWRTILDNFMGSFQKRGVIILFIPLGKHDINRSFEHRVGELPSPPGLQMDEDSFWDRVYRPGLELSQDITLANDTPPFGYERVLMFEKVDTGYIPIPMKRPRCVYCDNVGFEQMRIDLTMLGHRYEMAVNVCVPCIRDAHDGLMSMAVFPEVSFGPG